MCHEPSGRLDRSGEIVVLFAYFMGSVLENARHKANPFGCIRSYEGRGCPAEIMQTHGFAELRSDAGPDNVVDAACR